MSQSSWRTVQLQPYQVPKLLINQEIEKVLQNIKRSGQRQIEIELKFKRESDLQKFMKIYEQQIYEEEYNDLENERNRKQNKFRRCKDIDDKEFEVRQLAFPSFHFVNLFMKIYETRLKQLEIEYQYRFYMQKNKFQVYFKKGTKISEFFRNEIFEMKTKLNLHYCNNQTVVNKIKYSNYFNALIEKKSLAAEYHKRLLKVDVAIFYSNVHEKKSIIDIINKNLLQHMTILNFMDKKLKPETGQIVFKLVYSILEEKIKKIRKEEEIIIEPNYQQCCILIHDRHECFVDAKNNILASIKELIAFKLEGNDMRNFFNIVIRDTRNYPFLKVKYHHRSLYCVIDCQKLQSNRKYIATVSEFLQKYFEQFQHKDQITLFLNFTDYPDFLDFFFNISTDKNVALLNFNEFTINEGYETRKIILGVKDLGYMNVSRTRRNFFEILLKIILKTSNVSNIMQTVYTKFDDQKEIFGFENSSEVSVILSQSMTQTNIPETALKPSTEKQINQPQKIQEEQSLGQEVPQLISRTSSSIKYKQKEKKPKHIDLTYGFKPPVIDPQQTMFWNHDLRERKLQRVLCEKYPSVFGKLNFKTFNLALKQQINMPQTQKLEKDRIYISTIVQKNNQMAHHFIDLNELIKICNEVKDKVFFIFYKLADEEFYLPSYTIALI